MLDDGFGSIWRGLRSHRFSTSVMVFFSGNCFGPVVVMTVHVRTDTTLLIEPHRFLFFREVFTHAQQIYFQICRCVVACGW